MSSITLIGEVTDREPWLEGRCSVDAALKIVGRRVTFLLLREAYYGAHRFEQFVRQAGFSEAVTATRLRELVDAGLLERRPYQDPGQRRRDEYHLTEAGHDMFPALVALRQWGDKWAQPGGAPVSFTHGDGCGGSIRAEVRCDHGHPVQFGEIEAELNRSRGRADDA